MKSVVIFGGTTEGRLLSERLSEAGRAHVVCVAGKYGEELLAETDFARIRTGRMDEEEMLRFFAAEGMGEDDLILDATHPYATQVTENIRKAAEKTGAAYVRIIRERGMYPLKDVSCYADIAACARELGKKLGGEERGGEERGSEERGSEVSGGKVSGSEASGNIMLTTGSKELAAYCAEVPEAVRKRTYVRILPSEESLAICRKEGIQADHIIAMQGPFTEELNRALFRQYKIRHLVTKESGKAGGFEEKIRAAENENVKVHLIERPASEEGMTVEEVWERFFAAEAEMPGNDELPAMEADASDRGVLSATDAEASDRGVLPATDAEASDHGVLPAVDAEISERDVLPVMDADVSDQGMLPLLTLAGIGMGAEEGMTLAVRDAIEEADVVFGAGRLVRDLKDPVKYEMYRAGEIIPVLEAVRPKKAVVLFSGDTGFYSGANEAARAFRKWRSGLRIRILPGISSVAFLAAKLGESYEDAVITSLHGRNSAADVAELMRKVSCAEKTFVLLSGGSDVPLIADAMLRAGIDGRIFAGANLSYPGEQIDSISVEEAMMYTADGPVTLMIRNLHPARRPLLLLRRDEDFERDGVPMTKECIRHESLIRLGLKENDLLFDIGGGTGSVGIEAASMHPSVEVKIFEKNPKAVELIRRNAAKNGVSHVAVLEGEASELLHGMEKPDCVFIGGSGGKLKEMLKILHRKGRGIRFVITAVSLETLGEVTDLLRTYDTADERIIQLAVTNVERIGRHHMMRANNPVFIISFTL